ncbi:hypothetical protein TNCV_2569261 [Trichonephila clavipes]|nr:hypothetical protein TNCV_2569261 [Trichonephila clavipes]
MSTRLPRPLGDQGNRLVAEVCHEFEPSVAEDPPCRGTMHVSGIRTRDLRIRKHVTYHYIKVIIPVRRLLLAYLDTAAFLHGGSSVVQGLELMTRRLRAHDYDH